MSSLEALKGQLVSSRLIEINAYSVGDDQVMVEGTLRDDRYVDLHTEYGEHLAPGKVHHMTVRLLVGGTPPKILDAEAEMPRTPLEQCPETGSTVKDLIGLDMAHGFSKQTILKVGGTTGCLHLAKLILAMATPALHGWANNKRSRLGPNQSDSFSLLERIKNSCRIWREDGPAYQEIIRKLEELRHDPAGPQ